VGLPFANLGSPELQERLSYVRRLEAKREVKGGAGKKDAAAELYENMCMNAVNQSIGEFLSCYILSRQCSLNACM
jgi:chromosome transmission fidelity protein 1